MTNEEKLKTAFEQTLKNRDSSVDVTTLTYPTTGWDSLSHMVLCTALEDAFDIMFEIEEIAEISSFDKAKEVLVRHGIQF